MTTDMLPLFSELVEPWQRVSVDFRLFMLRARLDQTWAAYVTRVDAWPHNTLVARYMAIDLRNGQEVGADEPNPYLDASGRMALDGLGCSVGLRERSVTFSLDYLQAWAAGTTGTRKPKWSDKIDTEDGQRFLSYQLPNRSSPRPAGPPALGF